MITLNWYNNTFTADKAVKGSNYIILYNGINTEVQRIININNKEWNHILLEGNWTPEEEIPTKIDLLRADVDYLLMLTEEI